MFADFLTTAADWANDVMTPEVSRWLGHLAAIAGFGNVLYMLASWRTGWRRRGELLACCGPFRGRWFMVSLALAMLLILLTGRIGDGDVPAMYVVGPIIVMMLILAQGELSVCEHGVWCRWFLIRWNRFSDYLWDEDGTLVLRINPSRPPIRCLIRHEQRAVVQAALDRVFPIQSSPLV